MHKQPLPFTVDISQPTLDEQHRRLARIRWPDELAGTGWGWDYGVPWPSCATLWRIGASASTGVRRSERSIASATFTPMWMGWSSMLSMNVAGSEVLNPHLSRRLTQYLLRVGQGHPPAHGSRPPRRRPHRRLRRRRPFPSRLWTLYSVSAPGPVERRVLTATGCRGTWRNSSARY